MLLSPFIYYYVITKDNDDEEDMGEEKRNEEISFSLQISSKGKKSEKREKKNIEIKNTFV